MGGATVDVDVYPGGMTARNQAGPGSAPVPVRVEVEMPPALLAELDAFAARTERTRAAAVRFAVRQVLDAAASRTAARAVRTPPSPAV